ncbi:serine protease [Mycolicibacter kumamotonensis]|uniref:serine protease n=1 Tax=Mycolicibacter kumamotonensis TaxID=354243 RepID=UPI003B3ABDD0
MHRASSRRTAAIVGTAVIASIGLPTSAAAGDQILLGGGAAIVLHDDTLCTLTAMGHDSDGRLIGFTSAHCGGPGSDVVAEGAEERGTVGTVVAADDALGYAVIEFDPVKVKPIADYEGFGIFGIGPPEPEPANPEFAGPEPAPEPAGPTPAATEAAVPEPAAAKQACKLGQGTGLNCYDIGPDGVNTTAEQWWQPGDDGSPITIDNLIVGMVRDGSTPVAPPDQSGPGIVMFKEVLADVNAKGGPGAGFGLG